MHGFPLNYVGPHLPSKSRNRKSAITRPEITPQKIKRWQKKELVVLLHIPPRPPSKLEGFTTGTCRKEKKSGDFRLIYHVSNSKNEYVNDYIDPILCFVKYASFDEAVALVQKLGQGCLPGKSDIKNATRLLPVTVKDFEQLRFCFNNRYYFDKALPFGCSISCATFLEFAVRKRSPVGELLHYLDDFLLGIGRIPKIVKLSFLILSSACLNWESQLQRRKLKVLQQSFVFRA